ncbi:hypothetical protein [Neobacillus mesonae]|uniref:Uncharacterized protein n=1 Tax=Neobacillus mesonae TaxID=1193713 RepID=A0A3Q9QUS7_9BACI|nr:hypothetical protein [Neobacillus mesonae]AZU61031.1 hypothetical protein CHR53_07065 [Neobacillus mesonae]
MAKITLENGMVIEGTVEELKAMTEAFGVQTEEAEYRKVTDRKPKAGDYVKFYDDDKDFDITGGKYYEIAGIDFVGDPKFIDDVGDVNNAIFDDKNFEVFEKVGAETINTEKLTHNGAEYTLVHRKAQPGDVVVFTKVQSFVDDVTAGEVYKIVGIDDVGDAYFKDDVNERNFSATEGGADRSTYKVYALVAKPEPELKVGDYAKVVAGGKWHPLNTGDIVELLIDNDPGGTQPYKAKQLTDEHTAYFEVSQLVRATDEEVAEAKRKLAEKVETEKWAKIGRKPNEFKKGDIVRIKYDEAYQSYHKAGDIGEITTEPCDTFRVKTPRIDSVNWVRPSDIELIAPVEIRFNA